MIFKELDKELDRLEVALQEAKTMKEWDTLVHEYNALKIKRCQMTGESPLVDYSKPEHII